MLVIDLISLLFHDVIGRLWKAMLSSYYIYHNIVYGVPFNKRFSNPSNFIINNNPELSTKLN